MTVRLNGSTSGYTEIDAPAVAGSNTLVLPGGNGSADQVLATNGSGTLSFVDRGRMVLATAQNSTSGTSIDFTGIPSWVKRVTVWFDRVSTSGTSAHLVRVGTSSGVVSSGYASGATVQGSPNVVGGNSNTTGFLYAPSPQALNAISGAMYLVNMTGNLWVASFSIGYTGEAFSGCGGGSVTLSGTLDRLRITTVNGTDTFDAGSINLLLEG